VVLTGWALVLAAVVLVLLVRRSAGKRPAPDHGAPGGDGGMQDAGPGGDCGDGDAGGCDSGGDGGDGGGGD